VKKADVLNEGIRPMPALKYLVALGGPILSGYISSGWTSLIGKETRAVGEEGPGSDRPWQKKIKHEYTRQKSQRKNSLDLLKIPS
jgi:hypothetical protein